MGIRSGEGARASAGWRATLGLLFALLLTGNTVGHSEPPDPTESLDPVDLALLERPGAALGHAVSAIDAGEIERAERLLAGLAVREALIADYADLYRLRLYLMTGRIEDAVALGEAWSHAKSPLRVDVYTELGKAHAELGDEEPARAAWELALAATDDHERRAEIELAVANSLLRDEQPEAAAKRLLEIWTGYPTSAEDADAAAQLDVLEKSLGVRLRTADRLRRRGDVLYKARHNEAALEAYEAALALGDLSASRTRRARKQRAHTLFRMRRYTEASEAYAELPQDAETRIERARSVARAGNVPDAAKELERIGKEVRGYQGLRAKFLAALLWEGEDEPDRARRLYSLLASGGARGSYSTASLWRLGWDAFRAGRYDEALVQFEILEGRETDAVGGLRVRYWRARAAEEVGQEDSGELFGAIAREFPLSYYGWRASARAALGADAELESVFDPGEAELAPRQLARPRILIEAGLMREAREELDRLYANVGGIEDRLALAELYANAGDFSRPQRLVVGAYQETLARGPAEAPIELWWHAWPAPFGEAVEVATEGRSALDPALVYSIMREESGYRPEVRSVSGALGLLQLMPETAERVARREALANFDVDDLFLPEVNIRLGAAYLDELLQRFSGRASAAIGSYNAGPHRVVEWLEGSAVEDDEWVEAIPYEQTRHYVKRVLRSIHAYRVLY